MSKTGTRQAETRSTEWVCIDPMDIDHEINPGLLDERRAEHIALNFDPDQIGIFTVSERENGRFVVIDGQNRLHALRLMGWDGQKVECHVYRGLTKRREAEIFLGLSETRNHKHGDRFQARITAGDLVACAIKKSVVAAGYAIERTARDGGIAATSALEDVYRGKGLKVQGHNPKALNDTLLVVTAAWGQTTQAVSGLMLRGIGAFFLRYNGVIDRERLVRKLSATSGGPKGLTLRGKGKQDTHGGTISIGIAHHLTDEYNRGLRGKNRLTGWRESDATA